MRERKLIGSGTEHKVYESFNDGWVLKIPSDLNILSINIFLGFRYRKLKEEIEFNERECASCGILTPETRIFAFGRGYVMAQRRVDEDFSLSRFEVGEEIKKGGNTFLIDTFKIRPENFLSNQGNIYLVDLTCGLTRIASDLVGFKFQNRLKARFLMR